MGLYLGGVITGLVLAVVSFFLTRLFMGVYRSQFLTFEFDEEARWRFGALLYKIREKTDAGLVRASLDVFDAAVKTRELGGRVLLEDADGKIEEMQLDRVLA